MAKILKLGMTFNEGSMPDFGSIDMNPHTKNIFLLADDISKLNTTLTKENCDPYLADENEFSLHTGDMAFVVDWITEETGSVYVYHADTDSWYEMIPNE